MDSERDSLQKKGVLQEKSLAFAIDIVALVDSMDKKPGSFRLIDQIMGSGTSIGANIHEAIEAESNADFIHKLAIAKKECNETLYWLEIFRQSNRINEAQYMRYTQNAKELMYMLRSSILTVKKRLKSPCA